MRNITARGSVFCHLRGVLERLDRSTRLTFVSRETFEPNPSPWAGQSRSCRATLLCKAPFAAVKPTPPPLGPSRLWVERWCSRSQRPWSGERCAVRSKLVTREWVSGHSSGIHSSHGYAHCAGDRSRSIPVLARRLRCDNQPALDRFRPVRRDRFKFDRQVNVFTGPNNSGRSSALLMLGELLVYPSQPQTSCIVQIDQSGSSSTLREQR